MNYTATALLRKARVVFDEMVRAAKWGVPDRSRHYRALFRRWQLRDVTFIGITGSAGKTTTKELVTAILRTRGSCHSSQESLNDHETADRTVLATRRSHRFSVVEVGAPRPGYLDRSLRTVRPVIGVLTVVAQEHYVAYRRIDAIAHEKRKIVDFLPPDGVAVLNRDDPRVLAIGESARTRVIWVGKSEGSTLRLLDAHSRWPDPLTMAVEYDGRRYQVRTRLHGVQLVTPALCALGVAVAVGMSIEQAIEGLGGAPGATGRMKIETLEDGVTFVRDDFKAPQWSLQASLEFLGAARAERKVAVIGTISDSPNEASRRYAKAAREALAVADLVLIVGSHTISADRASRIRSDGSLQCFLSVEDAATFLRNELRSGDLVLLKGTNKVDHLVRILLDRRRSVKCWSSSCRRQSFCEDCPRVYSDAVPAIEPAMVPAIGTTTLPTEVGAASGPRGAAVVVGLGNPGDAYRNTAHNVGQRVLDRFAEAEGCAWSASRHGSEARISLDEATVLLLKLNQPMNSSGPGLKAFLIERGYHPNDCIVVLDDADLPLGEARIKRAGGDAGHKGMRSVLQSLSTDAVCRVRIGVRDEGGRVAAAGVVLSGFEPRHETNLEYGLAGAARLVRDLVAERRRRESAVVE